jgi:hypothetical protein
MMLIVPLDDITDSLLDMYVTAVHDDIVCAAVLLPLPLRYNSMRSISLLLLAIALLITVTTLLYHAGGSWSTDDVIKP